MAGSLLGYLREFFETHDDVSLVANDPALTAELILLFRVVLADGTVREEEVEAFRRICETAFGISPQSLNDVYKYIREFGYETTAEQAAQLFAELPEERRQRLLDNMIAIAGADAELSPQEVKLVKRTADLLGFSVQGTAADID